MKNSDDFEVKLLQVLAGIGSNAGTYEDRKVDVFQDNEKKIFISTAKVNDGFKPFETAVSYPDYDGGKLIIVESYNTKEEAQQGHNKWIKVMTSEVLPDFLVDCCNTLVSQMYKDAGGNLTFKRERK